MTRHNITYYGIWWFPDKPEETFQAILGIEEDRANLFALGRFNHPTMPFQSEIELVNGLATDLSTQKDYSFKLYHLHESRRGLGALNKFTLSSHLWLKGSPNKVKEANKFKSLKLSSFPWKFWLNKTGFKIDLLPDGNDGEFSYRHEYVQPQTINLFQNETIKINVFFRASASHSLREAIVLIEDPILNIEFQEGIEFQAVGEFRQLVERFIMTLWEEPHLFTKTEVVTAASVVFEVFDNRGKLDCSTRSAYTFDEFVLRSQKLFSTWLTVNDKYEYPIKTFFFALSGYRMDIHSEFLNYVFALEQFHRICIRDLEPLSKSDETMYNKALSELKSGDTKSWFLSVTSKGRNIRFSTRLNELINHLEPNDRETFNSLDSKRIEKTRHYLVHLDEKHKVDVIAPRDIVAVNEKLIKLMFKLLKKEITE